MLVFLNDESLSSFGKYNNQIYLCRITEIQGAKTDRIKERKKQIHNHSFIIYSSFSNC